jgi:hypothetical protein
VDVRGLSFSRPEFHLFSFPGNGGGAGFHRVESATGVARVVRPRTSERPVVTRIVINSASLPEMLSHVTSDRTGRLVAFVSRQQDGWTVYVWDQ